MPILPEPQTVVLDSSALLAYLADETGAEMIELILAAAAQGHLQVVSPTLCMAEALAVAVPSLGPDRMEDFRAAVEQLPVTALPLGFQAALDAAVARLAWRLQLPDAAAAVAAQAPGAILLTANPQFVAYERSGGKIYWVGSEDRRNELTLFDPFARFRAAAL